MIFRVVVAPSIYLQALSPYQVGPTTALHTMQLTKSQVLFRLMVYIEYGT